jgi:serine/threonine protein kinase
MAGAASDDIDAKKTGLKEKLKTCQVCTAVITDDATHTCAVHPNKIIVDSVEDTATMPAGIMIADRYEIKSLLGTGGMSSVYKVWDTVIKREVALKVLRPHLLADPKGALARFHREAQAVGKLDHQNIVKVHDFGMDEKGCPYLIMDFIEGKSLADIIKREGPQDLPFIIDVFVQTCDALAHAHKKGVVHRDLKPSNIMLVDNNQVKILDFGIAKILTPEGSMELELTRTGEICGSPLYMSPEQCQGKKLDKRSDIYSIGCVIYESFTGVPPLKADSQYQTLYKQINEMPPPIASLRPNAKEASKIETIILRSMAKKPEDRFQSIDELKNALTKLGAPQQSGLFARVKDQIELGQRQRAARHLVSREFKMACLTILAATLFFSAAAITVSHISHNTEIAKIEMPSYLQAWQKQDTEGQEAFDRGDYTKAQKSFDEAYQLADKMQNPDRILTSLYELLDLQRAKEIINPKLSGDKAFLQQKEKLEKEIAQRRDDQEKPARDLEKQLAAGAMPKSSDTIALCKQAIEMGAALGDQCHFQLAQQLLQKALVLAKTTNDGELISNCLFSIGYIYHQQYDMVNARKYYQLALNKRQEALAATKRSSQYDPIIARYLVVLARTAIDQRVQLKEAEDMLNRALEIYVGICHPRSARVAWVHYYLAKLHDAAGNRSEAKAEVQKAIDMCRDVPNQPSTADDQGLAERTLVHCLGLQARLNTEQLTDDLHPSGQAHKALADKSTREAGIEKDLDEAIGIQERLYKASENEDLKRLLVEKGNFYMAKVDNSHAENIFYPFIDTHDNTNSLTSAKYMFVRALTLTLRLPVLDSDRVLWSLYTYLGRVNRKLSDHAAAKTMYNMALEMSMKAFGRNSHQSEIVRKEMIWNYLDTVNRNSAEFRFPGPISGDSEIRTANHPER